MDTPKTDARLVRRFSEVVSLIDRGKLETACNEAMREALTALSERPDQKGKATIKLELEVSLQGELTQIKPKLTVKLPEGGAFAPLVVWQHEGALSLQHPSQIDMFGGPRPVTADTQKVAAAE